MTAFVLLCAGGSRRFGGTVPKLLASFRGRPLASWALESAARAADPVGELIVVTGPVDLSGLLPTGALAVANPDWASGQASSLMAGVAEAAARDHEAIVVGLGDQPLVPPEAWSTVAASGAAIAVATFDGRRAPPTRLSAAVWPLLSSQGDEGARVLMRERPDLVTEVPCPGKAVDIDTIEDLARWS